MLAPAIVLLSAGLPIAWILFSLVTTPGSFHEFIPDDFRLKLLLRTIVYNSSAGVLATLFALPVALVLGRHPRRRWWTGWMWICLPIGLLIPSIVYAYAWSEMLNLMSIAPSPQSMGDILRCIVSLAAWLWPAPAIAMALALRRVDSSVWQQAQLDGATGRLLVRQLLAPAVVGTAAVTLLAMQEFSVYEKTGISVLATEVRMIFDTGSYSSLANPINAPVTGGFITASASDQDSRAAAAFAAGLPMLLISVVLASIVAAWASRMIIEWETSDVLASRVDVQTRGALLPAVLVILTTLVLPIGAMLVSIRRSINPVFIWKEFSPELLGSILIAGIVAMIAMLLATSATLKWKGWMLWLSLSGFLIGGQMLAIAFIRISNRLHLGPARDTILLVLTHIARFGWLALLAGRTTWTRPWKLLREKSQVDGADAVQTTKWVILPLAWPTIAATGALVMALSLGEVPATVLLQPLHPPTLIPRLMSWVHILRYDAMIEASLMLVAVVMALSLLGIGLMRWSMNSSKGER